MSLRFHSAREKVRRGYTHIADIRQMADRIAEIVPRKSFGNHGVRLLMPEPPENLALVLGDAAHNLRSALDHSVWALLGPSAVDPRNVQYSIPRKALSDLEFRRKIERDMSVAGSKVVDIIVRADVRPERNSVVYQLHELDIEDKHHLIVTTVNEVHLPPTSAKLPDNHPGVYIDLSHTTPNQNEMTVDAATRQMALGFKFVGGPADGESVVPFLERAARQVEDIIANLEGA